MPNQFLLRILEKPCHLKWSITKSSYRLAQNYINYRIYSCSNTDMNEKTWIDVGKRFIQYRLEVLLAISLEKRLISTILLLFQISVFSGVYHWSQCSFIISTLHNYQLQVITRTTNYYDKTLECSLLSENCLWFDILTI